MAIIEARFPHTKLAKGNIFQMVGLVSGMLKRARIIDRAEIEAFQKEVAATKSYDEALDVIRKWVTVIDSDQE